MLKILKNKYKEILLNTAIFLVVQLIFSYFGNDQITGRRILINTSIFAGIFTLGTLFWNREKIEEVN
ncbi:hypothetical protein AAK882_10610 [Carnobacteriaceae bacterium 52-44]